MRLAGLERSLARPQLCTSIQPLYRRWRSARLSSVAVGVRWFYSHSLSGSSWSPSHAGLTDRPTHRPTRRSLTCDGRMDVDRRGTAWWSGRDVVVVVVGDELVPRGLDATSVAKSVSWLKLAFHGADTVTDIFARIVVARMSACRSACHRNNFRKSRVSDMSARTLVRMSVSVSASWNSSVTTEIQ